MAKNDKRFTYVKDGKPFLVVNKINVSGNSVWQKEIPQNGEDAGSGAHIILGRDEQYHYDVYYNDGTKETKYEDVLFLGSTAIPTGKTQFDKAPEQYIQVMPIRGAPRKIETSDDGDKFTITASEPGKIFYVLTAKEIKPMKTQDSDQVDSSPE